MKKFSLEEYLKNPGRKIVTRGGRAVRILCTDRNCDNYPVVALVQVQLRQGKPREDPYCYTKDGLYLDNSETSKDLFFAPEKKSGWVNIYKYTFGQTHLGELYNSKQDAENNAKDCENHVNSYYITTIKIEWEE